MRSLLPILSLALLVIPGVTQGQALFTSRELNFSVAQLPFEHTWTPLPGDSSVLARSDSGEEFTIWASPYPLASINEQWVMSLLRAAGQRAAASGSRIEAVRISRASAPIAPSYSFAYAIVAANGSRTLVDGFALAAGRGYVLRYVSRDRASLQLFRTLVASFRIHDKLDSYRGGGAPAPPPPASTSLMGSPIGRPIAPNSGPPVNGPH